MTEPGKPLKTCWLALIGSAITFSALSQGTFIFDQQSSTVETGPGGSVNFQPRQPFGQSFVPSLSSIDFVRLWVADNPIFPPSSIYVNLLSGSITGAVIATTTTIDLRVGGFGYTNFYFPNSVPLASGTTYYFQPIAATGDPSTQIGEFYPNGTEFWSGVAQTDSLWFREGIVVPEPTILALSALALAAVAIRKRAEVR